MQRMLRLGDIDFWVGGLAYQKFQATHTYRWEKQDRISRAPAMQFTGRDLSTISLDGVFFPSFAARISGETEKSLLAALNTAAKEGKPLRLLSGTGEVLGRWVILEVGASQSVFMDNGVAKKVDFTLKLQEYGEDDEGDEWQ